MDLMEKTDPGLCALCGRRLTSDEIAATKKLVNRGAQSFLCVPCLAKRFNITTADVQKPIEHFKDAGCSLFF